MKTSDLRKLIREEIENIVKEQDSEQIYWVQFHKADQSNIEGSAYVKNTPMEKLKQELERTLNFEISIIHINLMHPSKIYPDEMEMFGDLGNPNIAAFGNF